MSASPASPSRSPRPRSCSSSSAAWGHPHTTLLKQDAYPVAITSSSPLTNVNRLVEGLHHGMLRATSHGIDFVVVHFPPQPGIGPKLAECEQVLHRYRDALAAGRECIVLGDFHSIHPADVDRFSAAALDTVLAAGSLPAALDLPRIDFVLASPALAARARAARWCAFAELLRWSDHPPSVADFALPKNEPNSK
jgi:exonuclease III